MHRSLLYSSCLISFNKGSQILGEGTGGMSEQEQAGKVQVMWTSGLGKREEELEWLPSQEHNDGRLSLSPPQATLASIFFMCVLVGGGWRMSTAGQKEKEEDREKRKERDQRMTAILQWFSSNSVEWWKDEASRGNPTAPTPPTTPHTATLSSADVFRAPPSARPCTGHWGNQWIIVALHREFSCSYLCLCQ